MSRRRPLLILKPVTRVESAGARPSSRLRLRTHPRTAPRRRRCGSRCPSGRRPPRAPRLEHLEVRPGQEDEARLAVSERARREDSSQADRAATSARRGESFSERRIGWAKPKTPTERRLAATKPGQARLRAHFAANEQPPREEGDADSRRAGRAAPERAASRRGQQAATAARRVSAAGNEGDQESRRSLALGRCGPTKASRDRDDRQDRDRRIKGQHVMRQLRRHRLEDDPGTARSKRARRRPCRRAARDQANGSGDARQGSRPARRWRRRRGDR